MSGYLTEQQRGLVAVAAAMAASCEPCLRSHSRKALAAGLSPEELREAVALADEVKGTPARLIREAAERILSGRAGERAEAATGASGCGC
jgi:AhpD family alkylhydroperoxidase